MLTQCSSSLPVSWFSMAIGAGKGWVLIQLLEKNSLEKVSVGLQGAECSFCKWGWGSTAAGTGAGRADRHPGFFFPGEIPGHSAEVAWEEGQRG